VSLPPSKIASEAAAQYERFVQLVEAAMPAKAALLIKYRAVFVGKFEQKLRSGWVPKKGFATVSATVSAEPERPRTAPRPTSVRSAAPPPVADLSLDEARRILAHAVEVFREWQAQAA